MGLKGPFCWAEGTISCAENEIEKVEDTGRVREKSGMSLPWQRALHPVWNRKVNTHRIHGE